jgi:hypothetical protein
MDGTHHRNCTLYRKGDELNSSSSFCPCSVLLVLLHLLCNCTLSLTWLVAWLSCLPCRTWCNIIIIITEIFCRPQCVLPCQVLLLLLLQIKMQPHLGCVTRSFPVPCICPGCTLRVKLTVLSCLLFCRPAFMIVHVGSVHQGHCI